MDWVHCNCCYSQPGEPANRKFIITNCGHLYCLSCKTEKNLHVCLICNREFTAMPVESGMSPDMEIYFLNPDKTIRKQADVLEFQQSHRMRLIKYLREKAEKAKAEAKRHREEKNSLKDELLSKCEEIRKLKHELMESRKNSQRSSSSMMGSVAGSCTGFLSDSERIFGNQSQAFDTPRNNFRMSMTATTGGKENMFTPPPPVSFQNAYRLQESSLVSPKSNTSPLPSSPHSSVQRKVFLPGDKGSSPVHRIGMHRLNLKPNTPVSRVVPSPIVKIPNRGSVARTILTPNSASKYNKYF